MPGVVAQYADQRKKYSARVAGSDAELQAILDQLDDIDSGIPHGPSDEIKQAIIKEVQVAIPSLYHKLICSCRCKLQCTTTNGLRVSYVTSVLRA